MKRAIDVLRADRARQRALGAASNKRGREIVRKRIAELDAAIALLEAAPAVRELVRAGAMLSNCAYNLKQCTTLDDAARRSLTESQDAWDAARRNPRIQALISAAGANTKEETDG